MRGREVANTTVHPRYFLSLQRQRLLFNDPPIYYSFAKYQPMHNSQPLKYLQIEIVKILTRSIDP